MESEARDKLIQLFYATPRAQEIYASLRQQREEAQKANYESSFIDIPDEPGDKVVAQPFVKEERFAKVVGIKKSIDSADEEDQEFKTEVDEPLCPCDEPTISQTLLSECDIKFSQISQRIEKYNSLLEETDQEQRELLRWSLKIVNDNEIIVEGQRRGDPPEMSWRTSVICDRISTNVVRSKQGTFYFLLGEIDEKDMIEKNFSEEIINLFRFGFPRNWRDVFTKTAPDECQREQKIQSENKPCAKPIKDQTNIEQKLNDETNMVHVQSVDDEVTTQQSEKPSTKKSSQRTATVKESSKTKTTSSSEPRRRRGRPMKKRSVSRSMIETNDAQKIEVQRSRSGRLICPVLDYWRGQRISTSPGDGEISIIKSNLEEDSRLTLVETSRSSGLVENPTVSSGAAGETASSGTDWIMGSVDLETGIKPFCRSW